VIRDSIVPSQGLTLFLARVKGHVIATAKDPSMKGQKLLVVEPLKVDYVAAGGGKYGETGRAIVAIDTLGAGEGQIVLISQGSSARMAEGMDKVPVDAVVLGIIDEAIVGGQKLA
jgi:ethanolamine utilization protein EutN